MVGPWSARAMLVAAVVLVGPAWLLTRREQRLPAIVALLVAGQALTHAALVLFAPSGHHPVATALDVLPTGPALVGHLAAALVAGWWLRRGERAAWSCARRMVAAVLSAATAGPRPLGAVTTGVPTRATEPPRRPVLLRHVIVLRGPPAAG
ncbi:hypothetical protein SAMN05216174_10221 [Actinokineospora iranica]|uniref:Uncharacterized protein n=2 Tax=Actinokineospora iranica TaxID=1271860 RepID=A0A1G6LFP6_9PSEU|nr:hypothetical protein SAMN05216174_10221 [Actinokineospora iranica]